MCIIYLNLSVQRGGKIAVICLCLLFVFRGMGAERYEPAVCGDQLYQDRIRSHFKQEVNNNYVFESSFFKEILIFTKS